MLFMLQIKESGHQYMLSSGKKHLSLLRADQKFLLVPLGFMILRVWDIVISILYVYSQPHDTDQDETEHYKPLVYLNVSCVCVCVFVCMCVCVCVCVCVFVSVFVSVCVFTYICVHM